MGQGRIAVAGTIGVVLIGCAYWWSREANPPTTSTSHGVKVVHGKDEHPMAVASLDALRSKKVVSDSPEQAVTPATIPTSIADDPRLLSSLPDPASEPRMLYKRVRAEGRDEGWATRSERSIRAALAGVPYLSQDSVRVSCAATLCEVRGTMPEHLSDENANAIMQSLQGQRLQEPLDRAGLHTAVATFGGDNGANSFTIYTQRR